MYKIKLKSTLLTLLLSILILTACGDNTATPIASTAIATSVPATTTASNTPASSATNISQKPLRNLRYCEVIPVYQEAGKLVMSVYNTQGLNECPVAAWNALNADELAKSLGAIKVVLNGPRYWMMDQIISSSDSANGEIKTFGSIPMQFRARIDATASVPYTENVVLRNTEYVFSSGKPVYQLVSPTGDVYTMQTYSQIVDPKLSMEDLANLGTRLKLPAGWQYRVVTPDKDLHLVANGKAYVIQDDLTNTYQKVTS